MFFDHRHEEGLQGLSVEERKHTFVGSSPLTPSLADPCSCGVAFQARRGQAYNETAFRYFLALERKRSESSGRPFLLLLMDLNDQPMVDIAPKLLSGLWLCLRETDFFGWYRAERVIGALLTELGDRPRMEVPRLVAQRVSGVLGDRLPSDVVRRLRVRVYQHPEAGKSESGSRERSILDAEIPFAVGLS